VSSYTRQHVSLYQAHHRAQIDVLLYSCHLVAALWTMEICDVMGIFLHETADMIRTYWVVNFWKGLIPFQSPCISYREAVDSVSSSFSSYRTSVELHSTKRFIIPGPSSGSNRRVIVLLPSSGCSVNYGNLWCYGYFLARDCWYPQKHFGFQRVNIIIPSASRSWSGLFCSGLSSNILCTNFM